MVKSEIEEFSIDKWYPTFVNDAVEAIIVPIPRDALEYLCVGPMILPKEALSTYHVASSTRFYSGDWSDDDEELEEQPSFLLFSNKLKNAVNSLGGEVFIKSNWHAPKDATWIITNRTLKCKTLEDIYWLLKSSDIVCKDLSHEFKSRVTGDHEKHCVVIKRWIDFHPGCEFRCFVKAHNLIGISQRDCSSFYAHISARKYDIVKDIIKFYQAKVQEKLPCANYVFDIARLDNNSVLIIDFQPFDKNYTEGLLFEWEELHKMKTSLEDLDCNSEESREQDPEFRFISEDLGVQPKPCHHAGMPYEMKKLCSEMRGLSLLEYLREEVERQDSQPE